MCLAFGSLTLICLLLPSRVGNWLLFSRQDTEGFSGLHLFDLVLVPGFRWLRITAPKIPSGLQASCFLISAIIPNNAIVPYQKPTSRGKVLQAPKSPKSKGIKHGYWEHYSLSELNLNYSIHYFKLLFLLLSDIKYVCSHTHTQQKIVKYNCDYNL